MAENDNKQPRIVRHIKPSQPTDVPVKKAVQGQTNAQKLIADKGSLINKIAIGICAIGILGGGWSIYQTHKSTEYTIAQAQVNKAQYQKLSNQLKALKNKKIDVETNQDEMISAVKQGDSLAKYQNEYATIPAKEKEVMKVKRKIMPLLAKADDNGQVWYDNGSKKDPGKWTFASRFEFTQSKVPVLFINKNKAGQVLAYTTGTYLADKKQFTNLQTTTTAQGNHATQSSMGRDSDAKSLKKETEQIAKWSKQYDKKHHIKKITPKEGAQLEKNREKNWAKMDKEWKKASK